MSHRFLSQCKHVPVTAAISDIPQWIPLYHMTSAKGCKQLIWQQ
mgnify:CR=1 FL=1